MKKKMIDMPQKPTEDDCGFIRNLKHIMWAKLFGEFSLALHPERPMNVDYVKNCIFNSDVPYAIARRWTKGHTVWFESRFDISDSVVKHIAEAENSGLSPEIYTLEDNVFIIVSDYPERPGDIRVAGFYR